MDYLREAARLVRTFRNGNRKDAAEELLATKNPVDALVLSGIVFTLLNPKDRMVLRTLLLNRRETDPHGQPQPRLSLLPPR